MAYCGGLFLVNGAQQCFCRKCGKNKALFSRPPFLSQGRVQVPDAFPSTVGPSNFPTLTSVSSNHAFNYILSCVALSWLLVGQYDLISVRTSVKAETRSHL